MTNSQVPEDVYLDAAMAYFDESDDDPTQPSERARRLASRPYFRRAVEATWGPAFRAGLAAGRAQEAEQHATDGGERRYTLAEARRELAAQQCMALGHQIRVAYSEGRWRQPEYLGCERCFAEWDVVPCRHRGGEIERQEGDDHA